MKLVNTLNTVSGQVGLVPEIYLEIPGMKDTLVVVEEDAKSYEPTMYKPTDAEGHVAKRKGKKGSETRILEEATTVDEDTQPLDYEIE